LRCEAGGTKCFVNSNWPTMGFIAAAGAAARFVRRCRRTVFTRLAGSSSRLKPHPSSLPRRSGCSTSRWLRLRMPFAVRQVALKRRSMIDWRFAGHAHCSTVPSAITPIAAAALVRSENFSTSWPGPIKPVRLENGRQFQPWGIRVGNSNRRANPRLPVRGGRASRPDQSVDRPRWFPTIVRLAAARHGAD
jgi:hypothetical protein